MAGAYQQSGGDIGTLLRLIQEEKSGSVLNAPPATDPNSPIRGQDQGPLLSPEAPGGTRNVSIKPEGLGGLGAESVVPAEGGSSIQPGRVVGAVAPSVRSASSSAGNPTSGSPVVASVSPSRVSSPSSMPKIGTSLSSSIVPKASSISAVSKSIPKQASISKAPTVQSKTPTRTTTGALGALTTGSSIATRILPALAESTLGKLVKIPLGIINYGGAQRATSKQVKS